VGVSWVYVSIHDFGKAPLPIALLITLLFVFLLASIKGLFAYLLRYGLFYTGKRSFIIIVPLLWLVSEGIQSILFNGFPWLLLGYTQMDAPLFSLIPWMGVYGVGWFFAAITSALAILCSLLNQATIKPKIKRFHYQALFFLVLLMSFLVWINDHPAPKISANRAPLDVALIQPNVPQDQRWDQVFFYGIMSQLYQQTDSHWNADLIIWPEGAIPAYQHQVQVILKDIQRRLMPYKSDFLVGLPIYNPQKKVSYVGLAALGEYKQTYHKQILVPFGEYVPFSQLLRGLITFFDLPMSNFVIGSSKQTAMTFNNYHIIPAICYEIAYPHLLQRMLYQMDKKSKAPKLLVTVSNDAWFGDSLGPYQHMQIAQMRALELGIPLIRSTNDGITAIVNAKGKIITQIERHKEEVLRHSFALDHYMTFYRKHGFLLVYSLLLLSILILFGSIYIEKKGR
jgi:apolipoprotein N-acyltransferase